MFPLSKTCRFLLCAVALLCALAPTDECFASSGESSKKESKESKGSKKEPKEGQKEASEGGHGATAEDFSHVGPDEIRGIEIGDFKIRSDYPAEAQKSTVRFTLYMSVKGEHLAETAPLVEEHRQKLRDEVITATRLTPLGVFEEPDLKTFRRRILIRLHRTLPKLCVEDLFISDFNLMVKSL